MKGLKIAVRLFCVVPFLTGALDMLNGLALLVTAGAPMAHLVRDPVLNSQVRFWGAIWFGFGIVLWRASAHLASEPVLFRLLCCIIGLSGVCRLASAFLFGLPGPILTGAMALELVACAGFLAWHVAALRRGPLGRARL